MTDTLIDTAVATAAVVVEADGRTASNEALQSAVDEALLRGAPLRVLTTWGARHREMYDATAVADRDRLSEAQLERRITRWRRRSADLDVQSIEGYGSAAEYLAAHPDSAQVLVVCADHPVSDELRAALAAADCAVLTCDRRQRL
ncbi:nucleotide-binding universal stress UspA family protein [Mycobacterium frederiksbergense]|uniref:Nucleotide-binding universal stress UspA family protein n=1 Tax=Mycolicibacterium frederiksbergense TaxID=117567 RepID=A0ABT6L466_9MYCO|nr:universal stress protein [Mycolicibacterium frederiksbergense]MDH6197713.1 nucleotide-binding universal stress UspA family protein [Mycolicibacterium frederiksbergense]